MVKYNPLEPPIGTRVRYESLGNHPRNGKTGTVVSSVRRSNLGPDVQGLVSVEFDHDSRTVGCYVHNLERITEEMTRYNKNLVGPKPKPVQEPEHPTPWRSVGRRVIDANDQVVFLVENGNFPNEGLSGGPKNLSMSRAYDLAAIVADGVNKLHEGTKDSPSPF